VEAGQPALCPDCKNEVRPGATRCGHCGASLIIQDDPGFEQGGIVNVLLVVGWLAGWALVGYLVGQNNTVLGIVIAVGGLFTLWLPFRVVNRLVPGKTRWRR
jgi:hypothetical protein